MAPDVRLFSILPGMVAIQSEITTGTLPGGRLNVNRRPAAEVGEFGFIAHLMYYPWNN